MMSEVVRLLMIVTPGFGALLITLVLALWYDRYLTRRERRRG